MLYCVRFQSHGGRGLCFLYFLRKGWGSVETTGFHMFLLETCHVKKYDAVSFGMFGAEYRASHIDYVCPWRGAEQSEGQHFLLGQLQGEVDRTTRGPQADHKGTTSVDKQILETSHETDPYQSKNGLPGPQGGPQENIQKKYPQKERVNTFVRQGSPIHQKIHTEEDKYICIYTIHCVSIIHLCEESSK